MKLPEMTIHDIQRALTTGELSAREFADHTLERIARINPHINAWTHISEERMRAEAENIDSLQQGNKSSHAGRHSLCGEKSVPARASPPARAF